MVLPGALLSTLDDAVDSPSATYPLTEAFAMIRSFPGRLIAALALVMVTFVSACSTGGPSAGTAVTGGDITVAQVTEPDTTDPLMTSSLAGYNLFYAVFDRLTAFDDDGKLEPGLASSWTHNADFTVWDFTLRPDVSFHNGEPLKASDVVFSYETVKKTPTSGNSFFVAVMKKAEATSDDVVRFTLDQSFSAWPAQTSAISIVPEDVYSKLGTEGFAKAPVGTGPFRFVSWQRGVDYVVEKNASYWGPKPTLDKVTFSLVAAEDARVNGVQSGSLDVGLVPPNQVPTVEGFGTAKIATKAANEVTFLGINSTSGPLADARVRQALSLAVDRSAIVNSLLGGLGTLNGELVAPSVTGYVEGFPTPAYDPAKATALLQEAGYAGQEITFEYATDGRIPLSSEIAQALAGYWGKVGIKIKMVGADQASHSLKVADKSMKGIYLNTWAPSSMDGDVVLSDLLTKTGNNCYTPDADIEKLYLQQQGDDAEARLADFEKIWTINADKAYVLPLFTPNRSFAVSQDLSWQPAADGVFRFDAASLTGSN